MNLRWQKVWLPICDTPGPINETNVFEII